MRSKLVLTVAVLGMLAGLVGCQPTTESTGGETSSGGGGGSEPPPIGETYTGISYKGASTEEKAAILGTLEKYAMDHHMTGITVLENGGYILIQPRIQLGAPTYITGYGFGILGEGGITADLAGETNAAWKRYLHNWMTNDTHTINALNAKDVETSDLASYISSSYWGTKMNSEKDNYDWYPILARDGVDRPIAVNPDAYGMATIWDIPVKTGAADGLKYSTASTRYSEFNGRDVELEDYITAFKFLLTGSHEFERGSEVANDSQYGIVGAAAYFNATMDAEGIDDALFEQFVHVAADPETNTIRIQLVSPCTPFFAMYGLSSTFYQPIPRDFIDAISLDGTTNSAAQYYGNFCEENGASPVDNILSLAPYTLSYWEKDLVITFTRNPEWVEFANPELANRFSIEGVKIQILPGMNQDPMTAFNEYMAGNLDTVGIPPAKLDEYRNSPETHVTTGDTTFKLNVNSCTQEMWNRLFGPDGEIAQQSTIYSVKPWMSNDHFLYGLDASINRKEMADNLGFIPSNSFFSSIYLIDPENGISYNSTQAHKDAMQDYYPDTFGYDLDGAVEFFRLAVEELMDSEAITLGTPSSPTEITIDSWWAQPRQINEFPGPQLKEYMETAFNDPRVCGNTVKLTVKNRNPEGEPEDIFYKHIFKGNFDLAFGAISGNPLDPLNFMETLRSDNSSHFTTNWGTDTAVVDPDLVYDGRIWSYNSLFDAANSGVVVDEYGNEVNPISAEVDLSGMFSPSEDGSATITITLNILEAEGVDIQFAGVYLWIDALKGGIDFGLLPYDPDTGVISLELDAEDLEYLATEINVLPDNYGTWWTLVVEYTISISNMVPGNGEVTAVLPAP